jgi:hypothetical protein
MAWAFARFKHNAPLLFDAIARAAPLCMADFKPQELVKISWAFATLKHEATVLFDDALANRAAPHTGQPRKTDGRERSGHGQERPQQKRQQQQQSELDLTVSDVLGQYVQRHEECKPGQLAFDVWDKLEKRVQECSNWERQNFWIDHEASLQMLMEQTIQSVIQFGGRSMATVTHSLVKLLLLTNLTKNIGGEFQSLWNALLTATKGHIQSDRVDAHSLSNLAWAYAEAAAHGIIKVDGRVLNDVARAAQGRMIGDFKPQELSNMAWSFTTLKHEAPSLLDAIARAAQGQINDFTPQEITKLAWAFATLNHESPAFFRDIMVLAVAQCFLE